jgi:hypothetical protein
MGANDQQRVRWHLDGAMKKAGVLLSILGSIALLNGCGDTRSLTVEGPLTISTTVAPGGITGSPYNLPLSAAGGRTPYTWSVSSGSLPSGLQVNSKSGDIAGTPSAAGSSNFTIEVSDTSEPPQVASQAYTLAVTAPLAIATVSLPGGVNGIAYSAALAATGGTSPLTWSVTSGVLPSGLSLNSSTGVLAGIPSANGASNFTVQVADSSVPKLTASRAFTITVNSELSFTPSPFPNGIIGVAYSATPSLSGGVSPYTWSVVSGSLPTSLSLNSANGAITGAPSATGSFGFGLQVTDSSTPPQTSKLFSGIVINAALVVTTTSMASVADGSPYSATLDASGGTSPFSWTITTGALPDGLSLDPSGVISGTPTTAGTANFTVQATDTSYPPQTASAPLSIDVTPAGQNNSHFSGSYGFLLQGFDSSGPVAIAGSIDADGAGTITAGVLDINRSAGVQANVAIDSGTFSIDADNRGIVTITSALGTQTLQVALNSTGSLAHFIEFDAFGPSVIRGNGVMKRRDAKGFSASALDGSYAFGLSGSTSTGNRSAMIGAFTTDGAGGVTSGLVDRNSSGAVVREAAVLNTSNYSVDANGRGTLKLDIANAGSISGEVYVVSANELFFVRTDAFDREDDLLAGEILQQSGNPYALSALAGPAVLHMEGASPDGSTRIAAGLMSGTGAGALGGIYDANDGGIIHSNSAATGNYAVISASLGRGTMEFADNDLVFYLIQSATAFVMDASGTDVRMGMFERQSLDASTMESVVSSFAEGSESNTNASVTFESGVLNIAFTSSLSGMADTNSAGDALVRANRLSSALSPAANGRITASDGQIYYVVSPTRLVKVDLQAGHTSPRIVIVDQ